jgi:glutamyl-tRNA reductase
VAAGLHSVVLGEPQVLGQVRTGLSHAPAGLRRYGDIALAAARELRRRESFTMHSGHLLDRGLAALGVRPGGRLLVLGAGHMGRLVAARGLEMGFTEVIIASRMAPVSSPERARFVPLSHIKELGAVDVIAGCLGASAPELDPAGDLPRATAIIDLGTPRNFSASNSVVTLAQLLSDHEAHETTRRRKLAEELSRLLDRRIEMASRDSNSALGMLRRELDRVRRREANRIQRLHPEIAPDAIEVITRSLVNQLFHLPAERLRDLDDVSLRDRLIELFVNDDAEPEQAAGPVHVPEPALMAAAAQ